MKGASSAMSRATVAGAPVIDRPKTAPIPQAPPKKPGENDIKPFRRPGKPATPSSPPPKPAPKPSPPPKPGPRTPGQPAPSQPSQPVKVPRRPRTPTRPQPKRPTRPPFKPVKPRPKAPKKVPKPSVAPVPKVPIPAPNKIPLPSRVPRPGKVPLPFPKRIPIPRIDPGILLDDFFFPDQTVRDDYESLPQAAKDAVRDFQRQQAEFQRKIRKRRKPGQPSVEELVEVDYYCDTSMYVTWGLSTSDGITGEPIYVQKGTFGYLHIAVWSADLNGQLKQAWRDLIDQHKSQGWSVDDKQINIDGDCINPLNPPATQPPETDKDDDQTKKEEDDDDMVCRYNAAYDRQILNLMKVVDDLKCEVDTMRANQRGLKGVVQKLLRCIDVSAVIPESWQLKNDAVRHLVVKWRRILPDGSLSSKYSTTTAIPYYRYGESHTPSFSDRQLGKTCVVLKEIGGGANVVVYGLNKQIALQTLNECKALIEPSKIPDPEPISTIETSAKFGNHSYRAYKIYFFEAGWHGESIKAADWSKKLV